MDASAFSTALAAAYAEAFELFAAAAIADLPATPSQADCIALSCALQRTRRDLQAAAAYDLLPAADLARLSAVMAAAAPDSNALFNSQACAICVSSDNE